MFADRRRAARIKLNSGARVQPKGDPRPRECVVTDISETGVRLYIEMVELPDLFVLSMPEKEPRNCRVVWRLGNEIGAEFF